jgi:hypothetical protein
MSAYSMTDGHAGSDSMDQVRCTTNTGPRLPSDLKRKSSRCARLATACNLTPWSRCAVHTSRRSSASNWMAVSGGSGCQLCGRLMPDQGYFLRHPGASAGRHGVEGGVKGKRATRVAGATLDPSCASVAWGQYGGQGDPGRADGTGPGLTQTLPRPAYLPTRERAEAPSRPAQPPSEARAALTAPSTLAPSPRRGGGNLSPDLADSPTGLPCPTPPTSCCASPRIRARPPPSRAW